VLREAGLEVGPGRLADALAGLDRVELRRRDDVYWTLRSTLVSRHDEIELFDRAFRAWFLRVRGDDERPGPRPEDLGIVLPQQPPRIWRPAELALEDEDEPPQASAWSPQERLRHKDFARMSAEEFARARALIAQIGHVRPRRRSRRRRRDPAGDELDLRRLVRRSLSTGGEPIERAFLDRAWTPRKLVFLCDISGSMEPYSRALLLFVHAAVASGKRVEAFAFGTRLTRLTPSLAERDPERALIEAGKRVVDWSGGTRIGSSLKAFNDVWGRRALSRGAVVVVLSDGWEREDAPLVGREMARLARAAYAVVWVNPLKGHPQYEPLAAGMRAALPHVDRFLEGHDLHSLEALAGALAGIEGRHAA
jgi:uncharacterized protein with von Willebrand factor type A (vWA) domain